MFFEDQGPACFFRQVLDLLFAQKLSAEFNKYDSEKDKTEKA